jgi:hypothetical protein
MLSIHPDHCVIIGWIGMSGEKFRRTMNSLEDEPDSLVKDPAVIRYLSARYLISSEPGVFK